MKQTIIFVALLFICGCGHTKCIIVPKNNQEAEFIDNPACRTTYDLVRLEHEAAVPLILEVLDLFPGETNASRRCEIIQGALWLPENCTNIHFQAIINKGINDASDSVKTKTTTMVGRLKTIRK